MTDFELSPDDMKELFEAAYWQPEGAAGRGDGFFRRDVDSPGYAFAVDLADEFIRHWDRRLWADEAAIQVSFAASDAVSRLETVDTPEANGRRRLELAWVDLYPGDDPPAPPEPTGGTFMPDAGADVAELMATNLYQTARAFLAALGDKLEAHAAKKNGDDR